MHPDFQHLNLIAVNNKEFQTELAKQVGLSAKETALYLAAFVEEVTTQLTAGKQVAFLGAGVLEVRKKEQRVSVNPTTKKRMLVPQKLTPAFRVTGTFKDKLKNQSQS